MKRSQLFLRNDQEAAITPMNYAIFRRFGVSPRAMKNDLHASGLRALFSLQEYTVNQTSVGC
jgi:hypothetical protein